MSNPSRVVVTAPFLLTRSASWNQDHELMSLEQARALTDAERAQIHVVVTSGDKWDPQLLQLLPDLKLVACFSTGYPAINLAELRSRGIALTSAAGVNAHDVADHAVALLMSLWHQIPNLDGAVRQGLWHPRFTPRRSLQAKRLGIVGLGRIGLEIAQRAEALGLRVSWWGPRLKPAVRYARAVSLPALAADSDILMICLRSSNATSGLVDAQVLQALGKGGVLVNVSRGLVVDEGALRQALRSGEIAGAALDVFEQEPPDADQWREVPNLLMTPHVAGFTQEAGEAMFGQLRENLRRYFAGEPLLTPVNDAD